MTAFTTLILTGMKISEIIEGSKATILHGDALTEVSSICCDSRKAAAGALFIAVKGTAADGSSFVPDAISKGAVAAVETDREGLARMADIFFGHPSRQLKLVGITGTNGKTTTVTLLYNLFRAMGYECGLLSTIANYVGTRESEALNTTADPITINSLMAEMVQAGCEFCFMEVSSIGVEQHRCDFLDFNVGIFSNLTHDHLDYHGTFAEYLRCKKLFFDTLGKEAVAVINVDDRNGLVMVQNTAARVMSYSLRRAADHSARIVEQSMNGMLLRLDGTEVWTRLIGEHNAYNLLAIYCAALALGADRDEVLVGISSLQSAKGRLETLAGPQGKTVVIDYAHTPDALEHVLETLREVEPGKELVCVFGCGGERDRSKRPEMAAIAEKLSDRIIVTADNSRSEKTEDIMEEICTGFSQAGRAKAICIADRKEAIRAALNFSSPGAVILLAGKGHENYQITDKGKEHFDEREICYTIFSKN